MSRSFVRTAAAVATWTGQGVLWGNDVSKPFWTENFGQDAGLRRQ